MPKEVLYLKLEQNAELSGESVHISDLGKLYCKSAWKMVHDTGNLNI